MSTNPAGSSESRAQIARDKELAHSVAARLAIGLDARVLGAGTQLFSMHGFIAPRFARFDSVIVDPAAVKRYSAALRDLGWVPRSAPRSSRSPRFSSPVIKLAHPDFSAGLDLYWLLPGLMVGPHEVFDAFWARRAMLETAEGPIPMLDRLATVIVAAHTRMDSDFGSGPERFDFFAKQFAKVLTPSERVELSALVGRLGGASEYRALFDELEVEHPPPMAPSPDYVRARLGVDAATDKLISLVADLELTAGARRELRKGGELPRARVSWMLWRIFSS